MSDPTTANASDAASRAERRWAMVATGCVAIMLAVIVFAGIHWAAMPPSGIEPIDPSTLHVSGEFVEANLGPQIPQHRCSQLVLNRTI
jgi:cytochrome c oxidase subunit II